MKEKDSIADLSCCQDCVWIGMSKAFKVNNSNLLQICIETKVFLAQT